MKNKTIIYTINKNKSLDSKVDRCPGVSRSLNTFTNTSKLSRLHPWYITGLSDGEACFLVGVSKRDSSRKKSWRVQPSFQIGMDSKDKALLDQLQATFGVGKVYKGEKNLYRFMVRSLEDLKVVVDHFEKFPLRTQKRADFELFKQVVELMNNKELTLDLQQIVNIRASINRGLTEMLKAAFPDTKPVPRLEVSDQEIKDPH